MPIIPSRRRTAPIKTRLAIRIDLIPGVRIGPGKVRLLEEIDRAGSISAAARVMRMTYAHAWGMLDDLNKALGRPLFDTVIGGDDGGGARLTKAGKIMVAEYRAIEAVTATAAQDNLAMLKDGWTNPLRGSRVI
jgi:molybdate transport system regulatory protein